MKSTKLGGRRGRRLRGRVLTGGRAGLTTKKTFEQSLKGNEGANSRNNRGKNIPGQKNTYKGPETGGCRVENHL